ncbi:MAG: MFS transporter [Chloroflexi bacterium]|nr:MFS transporter [Chloroflexota bacterium]
MRGNPALGRLLAGEFISGIGDWLYMVAILVVIYAESQSAVLLGVVGAARVLPFILLSVPAGIIVDRYDRRLVLLVTDVARGLLMALLAALVTIDAPVLVVVAASIAAASFSVFFGPAISAYLPTLVDEDELGPANSAWATLDSIAFIIGPAVAGVLIAFGGLGLAFLLNAASFAVVAAVLWRLPPARPGAERARGATEAAAGGPAEAPWRRLGRRLAGPFLLDSATSLMGGGLGVLTVVIAIDVIGAGEEGTGFLNAATGVGGVIAGLAAGALVARSLGLPLLVGGGVSALGLIGLALSPELLPAMVAIGVAVGGLLLLDVVTTTLVQRAVPDALRGRVMGTLQTSSALFLAAGSLGLPILAEVLGVAPVLIGSGVVVAAVCVAALVLAGREAEAEPIDADRASVLRLTIFAGLPAPRLEAAARAMDRVEVRARDIVVRQGDPADRFYVILGGTFAVTQTDSRGGRPKRLRTLAAGDVFGEIGLLRHSPRTATVRARTGGVLLALDGERFLDLVGSGPGLSTRLLDLYRGALVPR